MAVAKITKRTIQGLNYNDVRDFLADLDDDLTIQQIKNRTKALGEALTPFRERLDAAIDELKEAKKAYTADKTSDNAKARDHLEAVVQNIRQEAGPYCHQIVDLNRALVIERLTADFSTFFRLYPTCDILQEATIGLIKAAYKYAPEKGAFATVAGQYINDQMKKYHANNRGFYRIPISARATANAIKEMIKSGEITCPEDLLERAKESQDARKTLDAKRAIETFYLVQAHSEVQAINGDKAIGGDTDSPSIWSILPSKYQGEIETDKVIAYVKNLLIDADLSERDRDILTSLWGLDDALQEKTLKAVGDIYGFSKEGVKKMGARGIQKLKRYLKRANITIDDLDLIYTNA